MNTFWIVVCVALMPVLLASAFTHRDDGEILRTKRVANGTPVVSGDFPYVAAFVYPFEIYVPFCTGSLFSITDKLEKQSNILLTAAHCFCRESHLDIIEFTDLKVVFTHDLGDEKSVVENTYEIDQVKCHEEFHWHRENSSIFPIHVPITSLALTHDIAVVLLKKSPTSKAGRYINLEKAKPPRLVQVIDYKTVEKCHLAGWGILEATPVIPNNCSGDLSYKYATTLSQIEMKISDNCFYSQMIKCNEKGYQNETHRIANC